jgi:acyl-CoA synthetase (AMP-forming)/AMP-acid ligase II
LSPVSFLQHPDRWLRAISRTRGTHSGGPNFAYDLCVRRIGAEQRASLDLGSWEVAANGAEPIRPDTMRRFAAAFGPCGFRWEAFRPCYGLAEATLMVTGGTRGTRPRSCRVDPGALQANRALPARAGAESQEIAGSGQVLPRHRLVIVDPESRASLAEGQVGEIWVAGGCVAEGYWRRPEDSASVFGARLAGTGDGPFLRTGDLGFVRDGELFVCGRLKDLIVVDGRNHHPSDIEATVETVHAVPRPRSAAAFTVPGLAADRLVVAVEVEWRPRHEGEIEGLVRAVTRAVSEQHDLRVHDVVVLLPGGIPKTSSGKVQRSGCREAFLGGRLPTLPGRRGPAPDLAAGGSTRG